MLPSWHIRHRPQRWQGLTLRGPFAAPTFVRGQWRQQEMALAVRCWKKVGICPGDKVSFLNIR
jgi:hypothetical protein